MNKEKQRKLKRAGWRLGSAGDFLGLAPEERALVDIRIALARTLREQRLKNGWTQTEVAEQCKSSQSRVAKMEAGDPDVTIDLMLRCLIRTGVSKQKIGRVISTAAASGF